MPRRTDTSIAENNTKNSPLHIEENEVNSLNHMLAAVMKYISDEEVVEIDIEYLLDHTEGLRKWWDEFREKDRERLEAEIKKSLSQLPLEELEKISEQIIKKSDDKK